MLSRILHQLEVLIDRDLESRNPAGRDPQAHLIVPTPLMIVIMHWTNAQWARKPSSNNFPACQNPSVERPCLVFTGMRAPRHCQVRTVIWLRQLPTTHPLGDGRPPGMITSTLLLRRSCEESEARKKHRV